MSWSMLAGARAWAMRRRTSSARRFVFGKSHMRVVGVVGRHLVGGRASARAADGLCPQARQSAERRHPHRAGPHCRRPGLYRPHLTQLRAIDAALTRTFLERQLSKSSIRPTSGRARCSPSSSASPSSSPAWACSGWPPSPPGAAPRRSASARCSARAPATSSCCCCGSSPFRC